MKYMQFKGFVDNFISMGMKMKSTPLPPHRLIIGLFEELDCEHFRILTITRICHL